MGKKVLWTDDEWFRAKRMARDGHTVDEIAEALGRSVKAIRTRFSATRITPPAFKGRAARRFWTVDDEARAIEMRERGTTVPEIARALKRSETGIYEKLQALRLRAAKAASTVYRAPAPSVTPRAVLDRDARLAAADRRTLTQAMLGDPPPGYSALDRRS